jgi:subtilase family serine protease
MRLSDRIPLRVAAAACLAALLLIPVTGPAQQAQSTQESLQPMRQHVPQAVSNGSAVVMGSVPPSQRLSFIIHLPVRNQAELTDLLNRLADPASPDFRHWLSVAEFTARFGRTTDEYGKVLDFARSNGFAVTYESPNRLMLVANGTAEQIETAFHLKLQMFQHPTESRSFYAPDREPALALDVPVAHISGLNDFSRPHPAAGPGTVTGGTAAATGSGPASSFLGSDMRVAYNMGSGTGSGQALGLMEFAGYSPSDIQLYFSSTHQKTHVPIVNVVVDGGSATDFANANDEAEVCLDIEQAVSVAPGLRNLLVYIGPESLGSGVDGFILNRMATDNLAKQLSNSWWWFPDDPATDDPYFEEMAAQGQTFFNASGDNGAYTGSDANDASYPAEDVNVTTVGGTTLSTHGAGGQWRSEVVWNNDGRGSGGGPANDGPTLFPIQSWQAPVINATNAGSAAVRNLPDVALESDYDNYICYDNGTCATNWGGTSFAAPRWAAWLALVNESLAAQGHAAGLGFINPALYAIGRSLHYGSDFHDITIGNNDTSGQQVFFNAVAGYDLTTGWGSMNGVSLMAALEQSASATFSLAGSPGELTLTRGRSATSAITVTPVGDFTGSVKLAATGLPNGVSAKFGTNPATGSSVLTLTASGTATLGSATVTITGTSGSLTETTKLTLTVRSQVAPNFTLGASAGNLTIAPGGTGTDTIKLNPTYGFTDRVMLAVSALPHGVTAVFSRNPAVSVSVLTLKADNTAAAGKATVTLTGTSSGGLTATTQLALNVRAGGS